MKKNTTNSNARNWLITQHDLDAFWRSSFEEHYAFQYLVYQIEVCPKTASWHAQVFLQFNCCVKGSVVQRLMGGGKPHIEVAHHPTQARDYCMKDETRLTDPVEYGDWRPEYGRGYRTDLTVAKLKIRELGNYRKCLDEDVLDTVTARHPKWVAEQLTMVPRGLRPVPRVTVYYGPTLTGKTARCHMNNPGVHELRYDSGFINYSGQSCVLFDEFDKDPWPFGLMLKLLDRYPFQVNVKNGYAWWEATDIFITGTEHPEDWYQGKKGVLQEHIPQFLRRITTIVHTLGSVLPAPGSPVITDPEELPDINAELPEELSPEILEPPGDSEMSVTEDFIPPGAYGLPPEDSDSEDLSLDALGTPPTVPEKAVVPDHSQKHGMSWNEMMDFIGNSDNSQ